MYRTNPITAKQIIASLRAAQLHQAECEQGSDGLRKCYELVNYVFLQMDQEEGKIQPTTGKIREEKEGWIGKGALISWSSILVPGRPTLHLLSPCASHQKGICRAPWLRALSLANVIICASGVGQNWPRINKQEGRRTVNKQHIRRQSTPAKRNLKRGWMERWTHTQTHTDKYRLCLCPQ